MAIASFSGELLEVNRSFCRMIGYSEPELVGTNYHALLHPDDLDPEEDYAGIAASYQVEERWIDKNGHIKWVLTNAVPVVGEDRDNSYFIYRFQEVTYRKSFEMELRESSAALQSALAQLQDARLEETEQEHARILRQMVSGIAHDFGNALEPVVWLSEFLLSRPDVWKDEAEVRANLELICTGARDAAEMVRRLRGLQDAVVEEDEFERVDVNVLVEQTVLLERPRWKDQALAEGREIIVGVDLQETPLVTGNQAALREALTNLLLNAVDALPEGGVITLRTRRDARDVLLEVSDTGIGMTDEVRERCMEPFFSTKGERGTGVGMAMVHRIIQWHGGSVEIETAPGRGTTIRLRVPSAAAIS